MVLQHTHCTEHGNHFDTAHSQFNANNRDDDDVDDDDGDVAPSPSPLSQNFRPHRNRTALCAPAGRPSTTLNCTAPRALRSQINFGPNWGAAESLFRMHWLQGILARVAIPPNLLLASESCIVFMEMLDAFGTSSPLMYVIEIFSQITNLDHILVEHLRGRGYGLINFSQNSKLQITRDWKHLWFVPGLNGLKRMQAT